MSSTATPADQRRFWDAHGRTVLAAIAVLSLTLCGLQTYRLRQEQEISALTERLATLQQGVLNRMQCTAHYATGVAHAQQARLIGLGEPEMPLPQAVPLPTSGCSERA